MSAKTWNIDLLSKNIDNQLESKGQNRLRDTKSEIDKAFYTKDKLNMIRYFFLVIDLSNSMKLTDYKPSRFLLTINLIKNFFISFYDKNPMSMSGFAIMFDGMCLTKSELSPNPIQHFKVLDKLKFSDTSEISLQNAIEVVLKVFTECPLYCNREVLFFLSSISSSDPGDIFASINYLSDLKVTVSVISLGGETHITKVLTESTGGTLDVPLDENKYQAVVMKYSNPPPLKEDHITRVLIPISFPIKKYERVPVLCSCHNELRNEIYECQTCQAKICDIPSQCVICKANLVGSHHLARTHNNLFKIKPFELKWMKLPEVERKFCCACDIELSKTPFEKDECNISKCPECENLFCLECDIYIHDSLQNCPGCL